MYDTVVVSERAVDWCCLSSPANQGDTKHKSKKADKRKRFIFGAGRRVPTQPYLGGPAL